ncbi:MAG: (2Fe-2S) ferredoxin domain-containing protein [Rhodospirillales bacterium]
MTETEPPSPNRFFVCVNRRFADQKPSCAQRGSPDLIARLQQLVDQRNIDVRLEPKVCLNLCQEGPAMRIVPGGDIFRAVTPQDLTAIADRLEAVFGLKSSDDGPDFGSFYPGG